MIAGELARIDRNVGRLEAPLGMIEWFAGDAAHIPDGYVICDGRAISRNENRRLFGLIGTRHGEGDGVNTFNVPNMTAKVPLGASVGGASGEVTHLDIGGGATYDVDMLRLVPLMRKG